MTHSLRVGIDIGSTTTKIIAVNEAEYIVHRVYRRHHARQAQSVAQLLEELDEKFPAESFELAVTGSGATGIAERLGVPFVQEVVANALAIQSLHPQVRTAIELGGQDAKVVFFREDERTHDPVVHDMRMNGSCAGGTGAFIDEIGKLLQIPAGEFDAFASRGTTCYDISGRCGVFAKTDIQPLVNQGASKEDLALSVFHAVAKQTIGGLAQGLTIEAPVVFEGGPLTFNKRLVTVFQERLSLADDEVVRPRHPETIVAYGAAIAIGKIVDASEKPFNIKLALASLASTQEDERAHGTPLFATDKERESFEHRLRSTEGPAELVPSKGAETLGRHKKMGVLEGPDISGGPIPGSACTGYLGIDSGSTTTKLALVSEEGRLLHSFYANNEGKPLEVARNALQAMYAVFDEVGIELEVLGLGTCGYGEELLATAFCADVHTVETVAHALATTRAVPDATFLLDIGGQDMKAIWLQNGVVTNVVVNEACSSGCGSFLESFAANLGYDVRDIQGAAFASKNPAELGSRCTVFMNSSIIGAQRAGYTPEDILAGLCRSIVGNVFDKVLRIKDPSALGGRIVVQGGTFSNDAVVRAFEERVGLEVTRAPYPGLMGAIGAAFAAQEARAAHPHDRTSFVGRDGVSSFSYERTTNAACPYCANHCKRTIVTFSNGAAYVTGNRCERGAVVSLEESHQTTVADDAVGQTELKTDASAPDLFALRQRLLFKNYPIRDVAQTRDEVIGIPRVLEFWDAMPFWTTLFRSIGVGVRISKPSTRKKFEQGLSGVASDTVCFPAKLVHGHVQELARAGVNSIFMPIITTVPTENTSKTSLWMCAVVKGYPMVMRNTDDPLRAYGVPLEAPLFHWYDTRDRDRQLTEWLAQRFGASAEEARNAIAQGDAAMEQFRNELCDAGKKALADARASDNIAIVLAGRPYHNDPLVNHGVPQMIARMGITVLPPDALPGINDVDLSRCRIDVVNNYHARVLASALIAAQTPGLHMAQLVSFGCGHDAYLTDEIIRVMRELSDKSPLVLKVDESDATGPLQIRIRSFVETLRRKDDVAQEAAASNPSHELSDPYPQKFVRADRRKRTVLVPNTSHAFSRLLSAAFEREGLIAESIPIGRERAIALGKRYVHNDICFPAQITIGETIQALQSGKYDLDRVAVMTGKYVGDCRLTHYAALLRKALDEAGFDQVPIITNDTQDDHQIHPGYRMGIKASVAVVFGLPMLDALEQLLRRMRPYELVPGSADAAFERAVDALISGIKRQGVLGARSGFVQAIAEMKTVRCDLSHRRPRVLIVGEYLLNFHPGSNRDIELYLEANGLEVVQAHMADVIRKTYFYKQAQSREYHVHIPRGERVFNAGANALFEKAHDMCDRIAAAHPLYEPPVRMGELVGPSDPLMHHTFDAGEGVLIPAEIIHHAEHGCRAFVILQPFGCLPNHVCGRGMAKRLKELYPDAQILSLDFDPDMSQANIENRLQMLIMSSKR